MSAKDSNNRDLKMANLAAKNIERRERSESADVATGTYSEQDLEKIGRAIGKTASDVSAYRSEFEIAARMYKFFSEDKRTPVRVTPTEMKRRLDQIASYADKLLKALEIPYVRDAPDGPSNPALFDILTSGRIERDGGLTSETGRIGRLAEILDAISALRAVEQRAVAAQEDVESIGELTVTRGHRGDDATNDWVEAMMMLYRRITGNDPKTSVGWPDSKNEGKASGPLVRFLEAAAKPLGLVYQPDAWASRVRTVLKGAPAQN